MKRTIQLCLTLLCTTVLDAGELKKIVILPQGESLIEHQELAFEKASVLSFIEGPKLHRLSTLLAKYEHAEINDELLGKIKEDIAVHFAKNGLPFVIVEVPEQKVEDGVLQLTVTESRLDRVHIQGNRWTNKKILRDYITIKSGDPIDEDDMSVLLDFLNRNPFRTVSMIYEPGSKEHTTDITFFSDDRKPWLIYVGAQNNGIPSTGRTRWFAGGTWKVYGVDHIFTYQYTTDSDFNRFQAHTFQYLALLPWRHVLNLYGGYSTVNPVLGRGIDDQNTDGTSGSASLRYVIPLSTWTPDYQHQFSWGADFRRLNNNLEFTAEDITPAVGNTVNVFQFFTGYQGKFFPGDNVLIWNVEFFLSPGRWLPDQSNRDYQSLRPRAENSWLYSRGLFSYLQILPLKFQLYTQIRGQWSTESLIASEQFGLGGYDTVRGYDERRITSDNGFILNFEVRSPPIHLISSRVDDRLQFLAFLDYGYGSDIDRVQSLDQENDLLGIGPGLRYYIGDHVSARLDWGFKLIQNRFVGNGTDKLHFSIILTY
jgi:hemolysin activation/secretion protein